MSKKSGSGTPSVGKTVMGVVIGVVIGYNVGIFPAALILSLLEMLGWISGSDETAWMVIWWAINILCTAAGGFIGWRIARRKHKRKKASYRPSPPTPQPSPKPSPKLQPSPKPTPNSYKIDVEKDLADYIDRAWKR